MKFTDLGSGPRENPLKMQLTPRYIWFRFRLKMNTKPEQEPIITLTEAAANKTKSIQAESPEHTGKSLRIFVEGATCQGFLYGMGFDNKADDDFCQEFFGLSVIVDPESAVYLKGAVLDYESGPAGEGFIISNPNKPPTSHNCTGCQM